MPPGLYVGLSSGNVGIGTTGIAGTSNAVNLTTSGASGAITVLANGNVGIGTTNPTQKIHINGKVFQQGLPFINAIQSTTSGNFQNLGLIIFDIVDVVNGGLTISNSKIVIPNSAGGIYRVFASISFSTTGVEDRGLALDLYKNTGTYLSGSRTQVRYLSPGTYTQLTFDKLVNLNGGDQIYFQTSEVTGITIHKPDSTMSMIMIQPL
jgi:hypothetical protein